MIFPKKKITASIMGIFYLDAKTSHLFIMPAPFVYDSQNAYTDFKIVHTRPESSEINFLPSLYFICKLGNDKKRRRE